MTLRPVLFVLLTLVSSVTTVGSQPKPVRSDQEILIQLERDWDAAFARQDPTFIERILADEFIVTYGDGTRGDRTKEISLATAFNQQVDSRRLEDFIVRIYQDTAIVWFTQHLVGPVQGKPTEVTYRYMDVWVMRDGRWQCVASQSTRVGSRAI
jgi:ketosteroid isomerase-like protein